MGDYIKRLLIAGIIALCVSLLFLGGKHPQASMLDKNGKEKIDWIWPADGVISDTFGTRQGRHKGIDIAGEINSPIFAVDGGIVEKSYYSNSYGNVIFIKHPSNYVTVYAHLSNRLVQEGQKVAKGYIIGKMGRTGQATGVHLHFETHEINWTYDKRYALNPVNLLGEAKLGEIVQAGTNNVKSVLEATSDFVYIVRVGDTLSSIAD
ncbi:MAG: M23 family metallopeptidase [Bacillota bacterium]|nr:M23 family metallopeptidase [Bacillota bacterium]